jgi:hypothetical protein
MILPYKNRWELAEEKTKTALDKAQTEFDILNELFKALKRTYVKKIVKKKAILLQDSRVMSEKRVQRDLDNSKKALNLALNQMVGQSTLSHDL